MPKIAFIGAGSLGFTRGLVRDILTFPLLKDSTIALMDINRDRLEFARKAVQILMDRNRVNARVVATLDRKKALKGADAVLCTILAGGVRVWRHDVEIPKRYGVDINVGDTRGVAGIFRALRTVPVMLSIVRDMERLCPRAVLLNYTNPMAMLCRAMHRSTSVTVTGLCHSVQGTAKMLARWARVPFEEVDYTCAGINHQAFYLKFTHKGKNLYPHLRKAVLTRPSVYREEIVRNEMFLHLGYYVTESSGHNSEYNPWFRKRPDLIRKYCLPGTGWNPGEWAYILKEYLKVESSWKRTTKKWFAEGAPMPLGRGNEYAASIINALLGGTPFEFNGNIPNRGIVDNLPENVCVETPVIASRRGLRSVRVGALPPQLLALIQQSVAQEEMAVEAALTGNPERVLHAVLYDPLTAAVLSMAEIKKMVQEMLNKNRNHLPQFKSVKI